MAKLRSLTALRACEAVARLGSVSAAAVELNVTRPAISKQIALMEKDLGCALFERTGNRITTTPAGAELCTGLKQAFDLISSTTESVARRAGDGQRVRLLVCRDFAAGWLGAQIGAFLMANPGISVDITAERNGAFRLDQDFDLRIFYGHPGQHAKGPLTETELCRWIDMAVCTQGFADRYLQPGQAGEVPHLVDANYDVLGEWMQHCAVDLGAQRLLPTRFNETILPISVAASGGGLAIGDSFLSLPLLRMGDLTALHKRGLVSQQCYSVFAPPRPPTRAAARFDRWLRAAVADHQATALDQLGRLGITILHRA